MSGSNNNNYSPTDILQLLDKFLSKLVLNYNAIADQFFNSELDKDITQKNKILRELLVEFISKYHIEEIYSNIPTDLIYWVENIVKSDKIDLTNYLDLFYKILELFGFKKEKIEKLTLEEISLLFYNVGILNNSRASVYQLQSLVKILNLENFVSIGELELVYDKNSNDVYFYVNWLTKPLDDIKYIPFDYVYDKLPYFILTKEDILNNIDKLVFPYKTNILYIHTNYSVLESLFTQLGAALFATKFKNVNVTVYSTNDKNYTIKLEDIPAFVQWIILNLYKDKNPYFSKNRQAQITNLLKFFNLSAALINNPSLIQEIEDLLYPFKSHNYSEYYNIKNSKLPSLIKRYVFDTNTYEQEQNVLLSDIENYLKLQYSDLVKALNTDIFNNTLLTPTDKKQKVENIIQTIIKSLLTYSFYIDNAADKVIYNDNVFKFINLFVDIEPGDNNALSIYIKDRVDVILTQVPIYVIPFIDYTEFAYVIRDILQSVPMTENLTIEMVSDLIPDAILYRNKKYLLIEINSGTRYEVISQIPAAQIENIKKSSLNINDLLNINTENNNVSTLYTRTKIETHLSNISNTRVLIKDYFNYDITED